MKTFSKICAFSALTVLSAGLVGCGGDTKEAFELQGAYQTQAKGELSIRANGIGCVVQKVDITGLDITLQQVTYGDADCKGPVLGEITTTGSYTIGKELGIAPGAKEMNLTVKSVTVKPLDAGWAKVWGFDTTSECKLKEVPVNTVKEVSGLECGVLGKFPAKGLVYYTSFHWEGSTLSFTKFPNEKPKSVGPKDTPTERNLELVHKLARK